jgi:two-component system sensor histidine kinase KdpD
MNPPPSDPATSGPPPVRSSAPAAGPWGSAKGYAVSLGLTALVTLAGMAIFARGNITDIGLLFLIPVMAAATRYGLRTGIVTGLASTLAYNFFFIPPTHTFTIENPQNIITLLTLLGVAIVGSQLAAQVREQALLAQASSAQNSLLAGFARLLTGISTIDDLARVVCAEIGRLLDANAVLVVPDGSHLVVRASVPPGYGLEMLDDAAARWCFAKNRPAGRGSDTLTASEWLFYPVGSAGRVLAVFGLARSDARLPVAAEQLPLLLSLLDQAGLALERIVLEQEMQALAQVRERDRLRHALLSSVSHDLRTPLTTIIGSLQEIRAMSPEQEEQLATTRAEAERLHRFVANLLDMVRIEAGALDQGIEPVDLADAVASALDDLVPVLHGRPCPIDLPGDLPFVLVDPQLFHHCLINLIENAAKYGAPGSPIRIGACRRGNGLELTVEDEGPGIPEGQERRIFDTFARIEGSDRKGGTGLGLAIVKGFAEAMGLQVEARNRADGRGAVFAVGFGTARIREWTGE